MPSPANRRGREIESRNGTRFQSSRNEGSSGHAWLLDHQNPRNYVRRNGRRHLQHDNGPWVPCQHGDFSLRLVAPGRHPNRHEEISPFVVLGCDRRLHDRRHYDGRLCHPLFGYRLCRGLIDPVRLPYGGAWPLVLVARFNFGGDRQHAKSGSLLLGAITFSQTLGTALGDWIADTGLGYEGGALVFTCGLAALAAAYFWTDISRVLLFWAAFILTRPLGATVGDFIDKPLDHGGLALSRPLASAVVAALMIVCILLLPQRAGSHPQRA